MGPNAELIVKMLDKIQKVKSVNIQPVKPMPLPNTNNDDQADPSRVMDGSSETDPPVVMDGSSEDAAVEVMDSEDELVNDMVLTQRQEQRLRRQLQIWRDRAGSSSSDQ